VQLNYCNSQSTSYSGEGIFASQNTNSTTISAPIFSTNSITNFNSQIMEG
jgi:hypothetical protein